ncbi:MAG: tetratricopeptide (TPR) repeat protein [Candidatus Paceibacteria bacterium]|jgi:tetratricopeptide (TPR) repeat protein
MDVQDWLNESESHSAFQLDLSCMLDGELDEGRSARAMLHLEECNVCRDYFHDLRQQLRVHRDVADPDRLFARIAMLTGSSPLENGMICAELQADAEAVDLVHRLATVFYQLGKSYILAAIDPGFRTRIFEATVCVVETKDQGRGFVDGVLLRGTDETAPKRIGGLDWQEARHMLNGRLERIESPLEKGRRLLDEALSADPDHEEARLYRAFLMSHDGRRLDAANEYRQIFNTAVNEGNRGHAATQLGLLYGEERSYRKSIVCFRWITMSGLADSDDRFFFVRFNLGKAYAMLGDKARALDAFETLLDRHPDRVAEVSRLFSNAPLLREAIDSLPGFSDELFQRCAALFVGEDGDSSQTDS